MSDSELDNILEGKRTIKVAGADVVIDPKRLQFSEVTLSRFMEEEAAWYDYFGQRVAEAEGEWQYHDMRYDAIYSKKFVEFKELGGSDKLAESKSKADEEVVAALRNVIIAREKVKILQQHLRAWDKCHENAQSRGHMIRKEMDKLNHDSVIQKLAHPDGMAGLDSEIDEIIGKSKEV
jgi:hypothetical protein